jgi:amino acid adenylation domain-containing protein/non-ribosomal peptide synthase protein (TIGR01720 family)
VSAAMSEVMILDADLLREREYWIQRLSPEFEPTNLVLDFKRPPLYIPDKETLPIELPGILSDELKRLSGGSPLLIYTILTAALKICLYKYTGLETIIIGSPALKESNETNGLPIISEINGQMTFKEALGVRHELLEAYERQRYPLYHLLVDLGLHEIENKCPLFDVALVLRGFHGELPDLKNDLVIIFEENHGEIRGEIEFRRSLFRSESVSRFRDHLIRVLVQTLENKDIRVSEIEILSEEERRLTLGEWNALKTDYPADRSLAQLFEAEVDLYRDSVAVACDEHQITYGELNRRANQLAYYLRAQGVQPEDRVGICLERSPDMAIALLGIVKVGGAYAPLDPEFPAERLSFMLQDMKASTTLTQTELIDVLPLGPSHLLALDAERERISQYPEENPIPVGGGKNLAYVMYTSGSTGAPKGVEILHQGVARLVKGVDYVDFTKRNVIAQIAPISFDASTFEIWGSWLTGGKLVLIPTRVPSLEELAEAIERNGITAMFLTPVLFHQMVDAQLESLLKVDHLLVGGDVMSPVKASAVAERMQTQRFLNGYGPTECTTFACSYQIPRNLPLNASPPIGRPLANCEIYIFDADLKPAPIGGIGELYIGGDGLARDYLNRPELTAEKYLPHPHSRRPGARLYKTGDFARYQPDGNVVFLGRIDHQVKIRGYRIELGEIEAALSRHDAICETAVLAREDDAGNKRIVAYLVAGNEAPPSANDLRSFLQEKLPDYLLPSKYVFLQRLPLSSSGKIDRKALSAIEIDGQEAKAEVVEPRTPTEEILSRIWREALGLDRISVHDNFFEAGGDSILSIQIVARANREGLRLTPKQIFERQTIAELASVVGFGIETKSDQGLAIGALPLTPIQHKFFEQEHPERSHWNMAVLLEVHQALTADALNEVIGKMLSHHDGLRLRYAETDSGWKQFYGPSEAPPLIEIDLSATAPEQRAGAIESSATSIHRSLDLSDGPLMRAALFTYGNNQPGRLLFAIHHLVVDAVSWRIILEDLELGCKQASRGERVTFPSKTTSFQFWAERQKDHAQSEHMEREIGYWTEEERRQVQPLPKDYDNQVNRLASVRTVPCALDIEQTQALLQQTPKAYQTEINDALLAALALSLTQWTRRQAVLIDLEGHGREELFADLDLTRTVGWFTTCFPVLLNLNGANSPGEALVRVKDQLRRIPNHGIGYGLLRYLRDDGTPDLLGALPRAEVGFNYLGQFDQVLEKNGWFKPIKESTGVARSKHGSWSHPIEIYGGVSGKRLQIVFAYSEDLYSRATIEELSHGFIHALRAIIAHCSSLESGRRTISDFPLAGIDQAALDRLSAANPFLEDLYPLSPLQQGMLFHALHEPDRDAYFEQMDCVLHGALNLTAFRRAWQEVVDRNPILRTSFVVEGAAGPLQVTHKYARLPIEYHDWRSLSEPEQEERLAEFLRADRDRGFNLQQAPLARAAIFALSREKFGFIWSFHHLLMDGWSKSLILNELFVLYETYCSGEPLRLDPTPPYREYIAWLAAKNPADAEAYWRRTLGDFTTPTPLMIDRNPFGGAGPAGSYDLHILTLSESETEFLQSLAKQCRVTLNTLTQCAWGLLLSRYSGEDDVVFGSTVSGRPTELADVERMIGLFINTLPVRMKFSQDESLSSLLQRLQLQQAEAREYESSNLAQIQSWSGAARGAPLFNSLMVFENYRVGSLINEQAASDEQPRIRARIKAFYERTNYPLTLRVMPGRKLSLHALYRSDQILPGSIERMLEHLKIMLLGMTADPAQRISTLEILSEFERSRLLGPPVDSTELSLNALCLHELFEAQAQGRPDATAVVFENEALTYRELNERSNRLARVLRELGVGPETRTAIYLERSLELVIGVLGVLKAGGAYAPLDPAYPRERIAYMLEDAKVQAVITEQRLLEDLPETKSRILCLDAEWPQISQKCSANLESLTVPDNLAYLIYTSGSTGRPKGMQITHRNVTRLFDAAAGWFSFDERDVWTMFHSYAFDFSVWEFWGALRYGGRLIVVPYWVSRSADLLSELLAEEQVTVLNQTPSAFRELLQLENGEDGPRKNSLRLVIFGGEALDPPGLAPWFEGRGDNAPQLVNMYGITETTVHVTYRPIHADDVKQRSNVIGRAIPDLRIFTLDRRLKPVPREIPGEMYIGGLGVGRGYWNRPELTAERFLPDPFSERPGERIYKSGDLARQRSDGDLEYIGRIDHQVKIRGFRVELHEIEAALAEHPSINQALVATYEDGSGGRLLVAYIVGQAGANLEVAEARRFLGEKLPDYMIPSTLTLLDGFPLTPSGKIDRRALPPPDRLRGTHNRALVGPRDPLELQLKRIWEDVLEVSSIGVKDNFFELGGHSLLAMRLKARIEEELQTTLSMTTLFRGATIEDLAGFLRRQSAAPNWSPLVALQPHGSKRPLFLVHAAGGSSLCFAEASRHFDSGRPLYGLQASGLEEGQSPLTRIDQMADQYIAAIRTIQPDGPYLLGGWSMGGVVAYEMARRLLEQGERTGRLILLDSVAPTAYAHYDDEDQILLLLNFAQHLGLSPSHLSLPWNELRQKNFDEQLDWITRQSKVSDLLPPDVGLDDVIRLFSVFKAHLQALRNYQSAPLDVRLHILRASDRFPGDRCDLTLGWDRLASGEILVDEAPGNHYSMIHRPHVEALCAMIRGRLESEGEL